MNSNTKPSGEREDSQRAADEREQVTPATPAPVSDEVRPGDTAASREYADKLGKEMLGARSARGVEEERRADRAALARRAIGVERVGRAARRDRGAERVRDVRAEGRRGDPVGRVVLEARRGLSTLEVADEGEEATVDVLLPRNVGDVAGERDVGPAGLAGAARGDGDRGVG